jgi:hypothetical protein
VFTIEKVLGDDLIYPGDEISFRAIGGSYLDRTPLSDVPCGYFGCIEARWLKVVTGGPWQVFTIER